MNEITILIGIGIASLALMAVIVILLFLEDIKDMYNEVLISIKGLIKGEE